MRQSAHRAGFFGDLVVDLDIRASRRRYGGERADPRRRPLQTRRGHASAKKPRGKAVRGGKRSAKETVSDQPKDCDRYFMFKHHVSCEFDTFKGRY